MKKINIIDACSDLGVHIDGSNLGPIIISKEFNNNNFINKICIIEKNNIVKEKDKNNLKKNLNSINNLNSKIFNAVSETIENNLFPITIGGDHSIAIASSLASLDKNDNLGIIWIDAHGDFNTFETTITGNIHGLPLAAVTGYKNDILVNFLTNKRYKFVNTVIVGARSIDPLEKENLMDAGIKVYTNNDIKEIGLETIMNEAIKIASNNTNGIHISYDLDVIDPIIAPGVSIPEKNGINLEEANLIMDIIIKNKNIIKSLDLVEYNPLLDINNKTKDIAINLLYKFIYNNEKK